VYCASIDCHSSTDAAKKLDQAGFTNVYDYRGGAKAWHQDDAEEAALTAG
jgi:rhodanese-related sulfurtransferase